MAILVTAVLLLGAAAALAILRVVQPRFRHDWLLAIAATSAAWLSVLLWVPRLPIGLLVPLWQSTGSLNSFATFMVSTASWPYALGLVSVALAVVLTAPARPNFPSPSSWTLCLCIAGLGVLAVAAEGPLTLVLFWAGLDLVEAGVLLARAEKQSSSRQVPYAFTVRLGSMALVLFALVLGDTVETGAGFGEIQGPGALLLPGAALLRLAAFAVPWPRSLSSPAIDEVGTILHFAAGASAIAFLSQMRPEAQGNAPGLLVVCLVAALYASWMWLRAPDSQSGRPLWILGTGSLAVAAALRGNPIGATGWGVGMLLAGSSLFLAAIPERWMNRALLLGLWMCSSMPVTVTAAAWVDGGGVSDWIVPGFLIAQAMLLAGLFHRALRPDIGTSPRIEVAALGAIYRAGISLPMAVGILLGIWGWPGAFQLGSPLAGAAVIFLVAALVWAKRRFSTLNPVLDQWFAPAWPRGSSFIEGELNRLEAGFQRAAGAITRTIEGEAGIMWSILFLVLFVSLISKGDR